MENFVIYTDFVEDWLTTKVDAKSQAVILSVLEIFSEFGSIYGNNKIPRSKIKLLFDGIFEIRVKEYRLAYFWKDSTCYLLHGIQKKRDDWAKKDIELLKKRKRLILEKII